MSDDKPKPRWGGCPDKCPRCDKAVYHADSKTLAEKKWHKSCSTCHKCKKGLDSVTCNGHEGEIYCKGCYGKNFGPKGYGFGGGTGTFAYTE